MGRQVCPAISLTRKEGAVLESDAPSWYVGSAAGWWVVWQEWGIGGEGVMPVSPERGTHLAAYQESCFTCDQ